MTTPQDHKKDDQPVKRGNPIYAWLLFFAGLGLLVAYYIATLPKAS